MDAHIKAGEVYLQPRKAGKKWKQVWLGLYPPSSNGVGRLEIQNATWGGAGGEAWRHQQTHGDKKIRVVRLSDVLSVRRLPPHAEALPKENMSAFCVETEERTMVFAALRDDSIDWVSRLCAVAFQRGSSPLHMEKNQIYVSTEEVCQFSVAVQQTEAATRCSLQGAYWLQVGEEGLTLREAEKKSSVLTWPYALLRRYGKDKMSLSIEAGRRCDSGPGTFTFKTGQNDHIFSLMEIAIKRQRVPAATTLSVSQEAEKAMTTNRCPRSPLPKIPDTANMAAILDNKLKVDVGRPTDSTSDDLESPYSTPADSIVCGGPNSEATGRNLGGKAIIAIQPPPPISTRHAASAGRRGDQSEPLYADPVDCRYLAAKAAAAATAVYVDPATVLPLKPPASPVMVPQIVNYGLPASVAPTTAAPRHPGAVVVGTGSDLSPPPDPVYSEVYDKVGGVAERLGSMAEPVYTEPAPRHETETKTQKPDPFAHLYAQVCKPKPSSSSSAATSSSSSSSSSSSTSSSSNAVAPPPLSSCTSSSSGAAVRSAGDCSTLSDVIYENLGVI